MTGWHVVLWIVLTLLACALLVHGCASQERDLTVYGVWAKRGQIVGDLAHLYCEQGAKRERDMMRWAVDRASWPAIVTIECRDDAPPK